MSTENVTPTLGGFCPTPSTVYNLVRIVIWHSATPQNIPAERIRLLDARRWLGAPSTAMPSGALLVNPVRPYRVEPRGKRRRPKPVPLMIRPRKELRQQLVQQAFSSELNAVRVRPIIWVLAEADSHGVWARKRPVIAPDDRYSRPTTPTHLLLHRRSEDHR